ncbi:MAG: hypothetical protein E7177_03090 [Erysipelotrichaceae bacterium]|nr:hypothetical protein [Erysipelotrichaceae bacterium]
MNFEKSKNAKEAIEYLRELFKGDITINGIHVSDELIQEVVYDRLDMIEKEFKNLKRQLNYLKYKNKNLVNENWYLTTELEDHKLSDDSCGQKFDLEEN